MKKFKIFLIAMIFALTGVGVMGGGAFADTISDGSEPEIVELEINSKTDFISRLSNDDPSVDTYLQNVKLVLNTDLIFTEDDAEGLYAIYTNSEIYQGTFDGNGYTITNLYLSSNSQYFGLFPRAEGATIENLRLAGQINFDFSQRTGTETFVGAIVGRGERVTISNCEIASGTVIRSMGSEKLDIASKFTYGSFAGSLIGGSTVSNCVSQASVSLNSNSQSEQIVKAGGLIGRIDNSQIIYSISYSNIDYYAQNANVKYYNGGLVGEAAGSSNIINAASSAALARSVALGNNASANDGALIGLMNADVNNINYVYYTSQTLSPYGTTDAESANVGQENTLISSFFTNSANWHKQYLPWDFDNIWIARSSGSGRGVRMELQRFQMFEYSFSTLLDNSGVVETAIFVGKTPDVESGRYNYKFGEDISITLEFKKDKFNYYLLSSVMHDATALTSWTSNKSEGVGEFGGYTISFKASDITDGVYSFAFTPLTFSSVVSSADFAQGGVKQRGGSQSTSEMALNLTVESNAQTIVAEAKDIYTFSHWSLYSLEGNDWILEQEKFSENESISVRVGPRPEQAPEDTFYFQRRFKLEAVFTDVGAMSVSFSYDDTITQVQFSGKVYEGTEIRVSGDATRIDMFVTMKEGYELQVERFLNTISRLYGDGDISSVMQNDPTMNEQNQRVYRFTLNMATIKNYNSSTEVSLNLYSEKERNENQNDLLWLWILLPIVGVLIIVGIVLFFVFRRYFYYRRKSEDGSVPTKTGKKKAKEDDNKKTDYKDYYY